VVPRRRSVSRGKATLICESTRWGVRTSYLVMSGSNPRPSWWVIVLGVPPILVASILWAYYPEDTWGSLYIGAGLFMVYALELVAAFKWINWHERNDHQSRIAKRRRNRKT
jgi:hypothetical protein